MLPLSILENNREGEEMSCRYLALSALALFLFSSGVQAQEKRGAILLQPESDMDGELADDLTEVLISAVIEKSNRTYRIEGKESFKKTLMDKKTAEGNVCLLDRECVRQTGKEMKLSLLLLGKVGKAMGGYRLEVWKLSMTSAPDGSPYRKRVPGDLEKLIEEVETMVDWVLAAQVAELVLELYPAEAAVVVDGNAVKYEGKPLEVEPGKHEVEASREGYETGTVTVDCKAGEKCTAKIALKKVQTADPGDPIKPPKVDDKKKDKKGLSGGSIAGIVVLGTVALGCAGGAIWTGSAMNGYEDDIKAYRDLHCPNSKCNVTQSEFDAYVDPLVEKGQRAALWTNILWGASAASAVGAGVWLVVGLVKSPKQKPEKKTSFLPHVGPDYSGFSFGVTF